MASIDTISDLAPIAGADRIEVARVRGWEVVVPKGRFTVGERIVFFETDSALPLQNPVFQFLTERPNRKTTPDGRDVHVLMTVRLRGQISQGLVMSLDELGLYPDTPVTLNLDWRFSITKWETPEVGGSDVIGPFPHRQVRKTGSKRIQNLTHVWGDIRAKDWIATEKVDGTSVTVANDSGRVIIASHGHEVSEKSVQSQVVAEMGFAHPIEPGMAVQGELTGPRIPGRRNPLELEQRQIFLFDMVRNHRVVPRHEWPEWALAMAAPVLDIELPGTPKQAIEQAMGLRSAINSNARAEGIVWHTADGTIPHPDIERSTFKVISNDYLLR